MTTPRPSSARSAGPAMAVIRSARNADARLSMIAGAPMERPAGGARRAGIASRLRAERCFIHARCRSSPTCLLSTRRARASDRRATNTGCIKPGMPVKAAEDRPWSPRRGPARVAQCPHERRSGARGEALWAPVGDRRTDAHAAVLSLATRRRRSDGPFRSMRWARWMMRSRMASARVGSPITSCQRLTGSWLVISRDPRS